MFMSIDKPPMAGAMAALCPLDTLGGVAFGAAEQTVAAIMLAIAGAGLPLEGTVHV